jgi:hypothetical protein
MVLMGDDNIWTSTWEWNDDCSGGGAQGKALPRGEELRATLYQLEPGDSVCHTTMLRKRS